jgi:hypothetical protein
MGGRGVALGSDINGAAGLPGPRFGAFAAYGVNEDENRIAQRRGEIERQSNGVTYDEPIRDYRWHRFESHLEGGYTDEEEDILQGIAQYFAGYNPWIHRHPRTDFPEFSIKQARELLNAIHDQEYVDNITQGLIAADLRIAVDDDQVEDWPVEQRAAYYARRGMVGLGDSDRKKLVDLVGRIKALWDKWQQMNGDNRPLERCKAGPRRDFDINLDGVAHYGMLPDFLQDLRNCGLSAPDLAPLFRSAYDYIEMWNNCERKAGEMNLPHLTASDHETGLAEAI